MIIVNEVQYGRFTRTSALGLYDPYIKEAIKFAKNTIGCEA
jgi:hypothetical protein